MPLWDTTSVRPKFLDTANTRHCIATDEGWVLRQAYTDKHGNVRQKEEILIGIGELENTMAAPNIAEIYLSATSPLSNGQVYSAYVVFDEPVASKSGALKMAIANTAGGNNSLLARSNTNNASIRNANNTLEFKFVATPAGTYKIQAQTLSNATATAVNVYSLNSDHETASYVIGAAVSNALGTFTIV